MRMAKAKDANDGNGNSNGDGDRANGRLLGAQRLCNRCHGKGYVYSRFMIRRECEWCDANVGSANNANGNENNANANIVYVPVAEKAPNRQLFSVRNDINQNNPNVPEVQHIVYHNKVNVEVANQNFGSKVVHNNRNQHNF